MGFVLVFVGGGLGAAMRYGIISIFDSEFMPFSYSILLVNASGSLLAGLVVGAVSHTFFGEPWRLFVMVGILSGFTTFSAFSVETVQHFFDGRYLAAGLNVLLNLSLCLFFAGVGLVFGRLLTGH